MNEDVIEARTALAGIRLDRAAVERLAARGVVGSAAVDRALAAIEPPRRWGVWVSRLMTTVGTALALAGVVWFFAFNWNDIPPAVKLGAIAVLIAASVAVVLFDDFGPRLSPPAGAAAIVLVGVFLAVDGQIHQTGADVWTLFAAWAGLTVVWAILSKSAAAWAIWIAVADFALVGWWTQTQPGDAIFDSGRNLSIVLLHVAFLAARETMAARGVDWPAARWTRHFAGLPILIALTLSALTLLDRPRGFGPAEWMATGLIPLLLGGGLLVYRRIVPDVAMLAAVTIAVTAIADFALFRLLIGGRDRADLGVYFIMGLVTLGLFAGAVARLRAVSRDMETPR